MKGILAAAIVSLIVGLIVGIFIVFDTGMLTALAVLFGVIGLCLYFTPAKQMSWGWWMAVPALIGLYLGSLI